MHVTTVLPPKYEAMLAERGGKDWGVNEAGMKQMDDNIGYVLKKLEDMGELDNTIVVFTTDNGAEAISFPDGGVTPFKGQKGEAWEGGYRAPQVVRWPGHIKPGTVKNQLFAALDWLPTFVDIGGGAKGDELKKRSRQANIPASSRRRSTASTSATTSKASPTNRRAMSSSIFRARRPQRCATRTGKCTTICRSQARKAGSFRWCRSISPWCRTSSAILSSRRSAKVRRQSMGFGGALGGPLTAFLYDWNMLPIGQLLWEKELYSYKEFPPLQAPETYNLTGILDAMRKAGHPSD